MRRVIETALGVCDARKRFSELLNRVARGETIVITRRGAPVARLVAYEERLDRRKVRDAIEGLLALRTHMRLGGLSIREVIDEGHA